MRIVYDVDDTLWGLNEEICRTYNIDKEKIHTYNIHENELLTEWEKNVILQGYSDVEIFKRCKFFKGTDHIFDLEVEGKAEVWLSSANLTEDVRDVKLKRLEGIRNINLGHIVMTVANTTYQGRKSGDILVDDSAKNIYKENFAYNILIDYPHNRDLSKLEEAYGHRKIIRVKSLEEAIREVEVLV